MCLKLWEQEADPGEAVKWEESRMPASGDQATEGRVMEKSGQSRLGENQVMEIRIQHG